MKNRTYRHIVLTILSLLFLSTTVFAAGKPEVISHTVQYLDRALSVNVQWQSENPVTKVKIVAGSGEKELKIDEYDNRRNPSGYEGEVSVVIPMEPNLLQTTIPYQIQLEDDLRQKSALFTGQTTPPAGAMVGGAIGGGVGVGVGIGVGGAPGIGVGIGVGVGGVGAGIPGQQPANDDGWGKDHIKAGRGQGESQDGKSNDMIDKLLKVAERFDTPPALDAIKVNVLGPENVTFTSKANDDKGIRDITFRIYDTVGNKAGEQILNNLGKKWEGSTQPIKLTNGGSYRVVAQAVDTAGNTSKEQVATFVVKGTPPPTTLVVTLNPQEATAIGALWQLDGGEWQQSAASIATTPGKHKLLFKDATGWILPAPQDVDIKEGPNNAVGTYTVPAPKEGTLTVVILPPEVIRAGAQLQIDGGAWQNSGTAIKLGVGKHSVNFKDVAGWINPQPQEIDIKEGINNTSATYTVVPAKTGKLVVTALPATIASIGAQWQLDGGAWQATGAAVTLAIGQHTITFKDVTGWGTPEPQKIDIKEGDNTAIGTYAQKSGTLSVTILPATAATAQWSADGGAVQKSGASITLPVGTHSIKFSDLAGWTTPAAQSITIKEGVNSATGTYNPQNGTVVVTITPATAGTAGAQWRVGTGGWQNSGASLPVAAGTVSIEFKEVAGWAKPANLSASVTPGKSTTTAAGYGKLFTTNADFEKGPLIGLEDKTVKDQLQLSTSSTTLPFIWVPNSDNGTISKVNSATGEELGRYSTGPSSWGSPSRTTVDLKGNCWVGNRNSGTVVKVGLSENGQCVDKNKNGKIETSTGTTALPWGTDECVLFEVALGGNSGPRGIAIDKNNNVWAGTYSSQKFYYIDGSTGTILKTIDTSSKSHGSYGAVIDQNGIVWSADISNQNVLRLDPATGSMSNIPLGHMAYGIGLDKAGHLFVAGWTHNKLTRINTITGVKEWTKDSNAYGLRGVAITNDGDVWVANSYTNTVTRWSNDGIIKASISGFSHPTGVATDAEGKVWCVDNSSQNIHRINSVTNQIELTKSIGGSGHYGYSDMTGIVARSMTTKLGTWTTTFDGGSPTNWNSISWNGIESANAVIKVRARVSPDAATWSNWEDATKNIPLKSAVTGRYIQLETTMQLLSGDKSPILNDLTITAKP